MQSHWKYLLRTSLSVLLLFCSVSLFAQEEEEENECVRTLNKAQKYYEDGQIEKVDQMIRPCLNSGDLSKEEQMQGYRLLALAKLYDGKEDEAEEAMLSFLKLDPEYQLQPGIDPKEFSELYGNYHTSPLYTIGIYLGPNWAMAKPYKEYGAYNTAGDKKTYSSNMRFQFGLRGTRYLYKGLNLHLDLAFSQTSFNYTHDILESYTLSDPFTDPNSSSSKGVTIESTEDQSSFLIPLSFSYTFLLDKKVRPYVLAGFETRFLLVAANSLLKSYFDQDVAAVEVASVENFIDTRNTLTFAGIFGGGVKLKIPRGDLFMEAKYNLGISDQVKKDAFAVNDDVRLWNFYEQDNDFTLDNLQLNIGYNLYLYKPRKMKQVKQGKEPKAPKEPKEAKEPKVKEEKSKKSEETLPSKKRPVIE
jgi:hypothetical protein